MSRNNNKKLVFFLIKALFVGDVMTLTHMQIEQQLEHVIGRSINAYLLHASGGWENRSSSLANVSQSILILNI